VKRCFNLNILSGSDNMPERMRTAKSREFVTMAVASLYLRKQIIFERV